MAVTAPPPGYSVRPATIDDAEAIADIQNETNLAEVGFPWTTAAAIRDELTAPGRDPDDDVVLVAEDGALAGYLTLWSDEDPARAVVHQLAFVRPAPWGRGLSSFLLRYGEMRAQGTRGAATVRASRWATNDAAGALFASLGYRYVRTFRTMRMDLDRGAVPVSVPDRIAIRTFDPSSDVEPVHAALAEAFDDHWGSFAFPALERWRHEAIDGEAAGFDPTLWFVATDGGEVVGAICARRGTPRDPALGQVDHLGVRRPWRGRGVGRALLLSAFTALAFSGVAAVELGVDNDSPTRADRLYGSVGMRTAYAFEIWEKHL